MTLLHRLASVLRGLFNRNRTEQGLDDELQAFIDMSAAEKRRDGLPPAEARRLALLELGGVEQAKARVRTYRHGAWLEEVGRDVRYGFRMFGKNPGFTFIIVLTLALGIGANTAIFSLIDALMLRWLPVWNPQELVQLTLQAPGARPVPVGGSFSYAIARALADRHEIFTGVAGFSRFPFDVGAPGAVSRVPGAMVTGGYYETLGLNPVIGRLLTHQDDEPGAPLAAVVSYGSLHNLQNLDPGFSAEGVLLVDLEGRRTAVPRELLDDVQRLPGVVSASLSTHTPLSGSVWSEPAVPAGQPIPERDNAYFIGAGPRFFATMQIHLLSGREFTDRDSANAPAVAIVNEVLKGGARLVLIGIALGVPAAWAASRWVESMLFGLTPTDPVAIAGAILLLTTAAQIAAYLPARRASRVDPLTALRHE